MAGSGLSAASNGSPQGWANSCEVSSSGGPRRGCAERQATYFAGLRKAGEVKRHPSRLGGSFIFIDEPGQSETTSVLTIKQPSSGMTGAWPNGN